MSKPYTSYSANVIDLAKHSEKYSILEYGIGDTVTLLDDFTDTREEQRIVRMKTYPDAPEKNSCTLANKVLTFDELAQKYEVPMPIVDEINKVLFEGKSAKDAVSTLMLRDKKIENPLLPW